MRKMHHREDGTRINIQIAMVNGVDHIDRNQNSI